MLFFIILSFIVGNLAAQQSSNMVQIKGGTFTMGSPVDEPERKENEGPQKQVTLSSFSIGKYAVTQKEYYEIMGKNPSKFKGSNLPVEGVNWYDAIEYCIKRSEKEGLTPAYTISGKNMSMNIKGTVTWIYNANGYRLPTEAEWEYACRAGTNTPFSTGNNITTSQANYYGGKPYNDPFEERKKGEYREKTTPVGSFAPNPWGLYDMHGNVWEWCWDLYVGYPENVLIDDKVYGESRVVRGGSWSSYGTALRSAYRVEQEESLGGSFFGYLGVNNIGFRVVRGVVTTPAVVTTPGQSQDKVSEIKNEMIRISGGTFTMGSPIGERGRRSDEVQYQVTLNTFFISKCEVMQDEYQRVMGKNPSHFNGNNLPVTTVSWYDAIEYCNKRSEQEGLSPAYTINGENVTWNRNANGYRLPTEAEWEYACRAGTTAAYNNGDYISSNTGWYAVGGIFAVGQKTANAWGLYDMHGNVAEWCWDWYGDYPSGVQNDPIGTSTGTARVMRGGSWSNSSFGSDYGTEIRSAYRDKGDPSRKGSDIGFRVVRNGN